MNYDLSHLTQESAQRVWGPIQDDEALLLYALIRVMRLRTVLEIGGLEGYSARNFLAAVGPGGTVWTVDPIPLLSLANNHIVLRGYARDVRPTDFNVALDLVFFDCHDYSDELVIWDRLQTAEIITNRTILALHDTNLHPGGIVHQPTERKLVNRLHDAGYDAVCLHTTDDRHDDSMPFRHGLTLMQRFAKLHV